MKIIVRLFGRQYAQYRRYLADQSIFVDWRATYDNLSHLKKLYKRYKSDWIKKVIQGMEGSLEKRSHYYREHLITQKQKISPVKNPLNKKFVILIGRSNVSAALDFIDDIKFMSNKVTLLGENTGADRLYMDVRTVDLPSSDGTFSFPIKVYRNRVRKDNQSYQPKMNTRVSLY